MSEKANVIQFNRNDVQLLDIASKRRENGEYDSALSTLFSLEQNGSKLLELYSLTALVYMDLGLYGNASKYWFKYLAYAPKSKCPRAYNALGACYYYLDNYAISGYYFERQMNEGKDEEYEFDDLMYEIYDTARELMKPEFYICYPPERIAPQRIIANGDSLFLSKKFDEASEEFSKIGEDKNEYLESQIKLATCDFCMGDHDKAFSIYNRLIDRFPDNKTLLLNMLGMLFTVQKGDQTAKYFELCEKLNFTDSLDCYKLAAAYCDLKNNERAKFYLDRAVKDEPYDVNSLFLLSIVDYNLKFFDDAERHFLMCYRITRSPIAKFYAKLCENTAKRKVDFKQLEYIFNVPKEEVSRRIDYIQSILKGGIKSVAKANKEKIIEIADWIFSFDSKAQEPFCEILLSTTNVTFRKYFLNQLLNPNLSDEVKSLIISKLVERGYDKKIGVVFSNLFSKLQLIKAEFGKEKNELWTMAFAKAFGKIAPIEGEKAYKLREGAYELYFELEGNGNLKKVDDLNALSATIAVYSGLKIASKKTVIANYFATDKEKIKTIMELASEEK